MTGIFAAPTLLRLAGDVALAVLPLTALFVGFQLMFLRLPAREVLRILAGTLVASAGLFLFLAGVSIGFLPFGKAIGAALGSMPERWLLAPIGVLLGFVTAWGEPSVRILAKQVEEASAGSIPQPLVLWAICIGVAAATSLGLLRIELDIPLLYILVPGYGLVVAILWFCEKSFVSIAMDSGGVATGPLANSFLLALAFGASSSAGAGKPLGQGLGLIALIALAPVVSVLILGMLVRWKTRRKES